MANNSQKLIMRIIASENPATSFAMPHGPSVEWIIFHLPNDGVWAWDFFHSTNHNLGDCNRII